MTCEMRTIEAGEAGAVMSGSALQEHIACIYRLIYAKVGNKAAAEDLTSRVFLEAARRPAVLGDPEQRRVPLTALARAAIEEYWRAQGTGRPEQRPDALDVLWCGENADEEGDSTRGRARRVLDALPEQERTIVRMRLLQGYSTAEIGRRLGIEPRLVQALQARALRRAASLLGTR